MSVQPVSHPRAVRALWVLATVQFSALVALVAGILSGATGSSLPEAALHAGSAFAATLPLCLAVLSALGAL
ncbi:hypothetical protein F0L17_03665 [Streptomyces sp. TRM43335]|uniref:Uncharacterized protein n=1 Tax=Streptomyces taklimakanensis TaxID=2569853 RepID=A0A6G2B7J6_9ACTN|nr:hypothetical protein [Streptomyces taklimakanensis]MTE18237.1 hypothetical protein [Streptomyces taklimakanensis]